MEQGKLASVIVSTVCSKGNDVFAVSVTLNTCVNYFFVNLIL
jgi:hypothetical protein